MKHAKRATAPEPTPNDRVPVGQRVGDGGPESGGDTGEKRWLDAAPEIPDSLRLADAASRLGAKSRRMICPRCGFKFLTGRGHLNSDFCLVKSTVKRQADLGFVRVPTWQWGTATGVLGAGGVELRCLPGILETSDRPMYRGVQARNTVFAPRWAIRVARATIGWRPYRRVALLRALQLPELAEVLAFVEASPRVPRGLLGQAGDTTEATAKALLSLWEVGKTDQSKLIFAKAFPIEGRKKRQP